MEQPDLTYFFQTKAEAADFSIRMAVINEEIYKTDFNLDKSLTKQLGIKKKEKFLSMMRENNIDTGANQALADFIRKIQQKIAEMPVVTLTLAIEPPEETMQAMSQWFLLNINRQILFDIRTDPKLIAGMTLTFNGKYKDYSIRQVVERILSETATTAARA